MTQESLNLDHLFVRRILKLGTIFSGTILMQNVLLKLKNTSWFVIITGTTTNLPPWHQPLKNGHDYSNFLFVSIANHEPFPIWYVMLQHVSLHAALPSSFNAAILVSTYHSLLSTVVLTMNIQRHLPTVTFVAPWTKIRT